MGIVVAIIAQGSMGAGVGKRLHESGAEVRTLLSGRSAASAERARAAGMKPMASERDLLDGADFFLSILPPGEAESLARRLAPALTASPKKPVYVDCNAISPQTAERVARDRRADRRQIRRWRHHRRPAAARLQPGDLRLGAGGRRDRGVARLGDRLARYRRADRRRLGSQDVLCRDHQGHHRARLGDDARRGAFRLRRGAGRGTVAEPAADART